MDTETVTANRVLVAVDGSPAPLEALRVGAPVANPSTFEAFRGGVAPTIEIFALEVDPAQGLLGSSHESAMIVVGSRDHSAPASTGSDLTVDRRMVVTL